MAKIDLKPSSGLPLFFTGDQIQSDTHKPQAISSVTIDDIRPQILNEDLDCPRIFYTKYKNIDNDEKEFEKNNLRVNLFFIQPNLAGIEYVKTKATRCHNYPRIIEVVYGGGTALIQHYKSAVNNRVIRIQLKKGTKFIIPQGYSACFINNRQTSNLILVEVSSSKAQTRVVLEEKRGMSYYVIRKNAKLETVRNPLYKIVNEIENIDWSPILKEYGLTLKTPVLKQLLRNNDKYDWLHKENSVTL
jgi:oxalate decarboxylase/phosphoglucose isomerase-like protein (cupin superfamily)